MRLWIPRVLFKLRIIPRTGEGLPSRTGENEATSSVLFNGDRQKADGKVAEGWQSVSKNLICALLPRNSSQSRPWNLRTH